MSYSYNSSTATTIRLNTGIDLSTAQSAQIKYIDANKEEGFWVATIDDPATDGKISYTPDSEDVPLPTGTWKLWAFITFQNGTVIPTCPTEMEMLKEGASCG